MHMKDFMTAERKASSNSLRKEDRDIEGDERGSAQEKTLEVQKNEVRVAGSNSEVS